MLTVSGGTFNDNQAFGDSHMTGGPGDTFSVPLGDAKGGAITNDGPGNITNSTFENNEADAGSGNTGGSEDFVVGAARGRRLQFRGPPVLFLQRALGADSRPGNRRQGSSRPGMPG